MKTSKEGMKLIEQFEGMRTKAYLCSAKVPTIGIGSTLYEDGKKVKIGDTITLERAYSLFSITLKKYEDSVSNNVKSVLNQNQYDALVSLCYNIGPGNFKSSTVLKLVNKNPNDPAITEAFSRWNKAAGVVVKGLVTRRTKEAEYYFKK